MAPIPRHRVEIERAAQPLPRFLDMESHLIAPTRIEQIVGRRSLEIEPDRVRRAGLLAGPGIEAERDEIVPERQVVEDAVGNGAGGVLG